MGISEVNLGGDDPATGQVVELGPGSLDIHGDGGGLDEDVVVLNSGGGRAVLDGKGF